MQAVPSARMLWIVGCGCVALAIAAAFVPNGESILGAVLAALALAAAADWLLSRDRLAGVNVQLPDLIRLFKEREAEVPVRIDLTNSAAPQRLRLGLAFPDGIATAREDEWIEFAAASGQTNWQLTGERRGQYRVEAAALECPSRLGLWDVRRRLELSSEVRVYPRVRKAKDLALLRHLQTGQRALRQVGKGREFEKLREYSPGDGFDEIHWKATARRASPVTKVFQVERTQEVYVLIDAGRMSAREIDGESILDRYLESSLLMALAAESRGDLFGLATFSDRVHGFVRARNGKAHYGACRELIYNLNPSPVSADFEALAAFLRPALSRRALLIVLSSFDDPVAAESFARAGKILAQKHLVIAGALRPAAARPVFAREDAPANVDGIYDNLAGHMAWHRLKQIELSWRRQGVRLSLLEPDTLNAQLLAIYDEVKQRQLL